MHRFKNVVYIIKYIVTLEFQALFIVSVQTRNRTRCFYSRPWW